jgi:hypothetical protein
MPCLLCNKDVAENDESLEVQTTDNRTVTVHKQCYEDYVKAMTMCGAGCSSCGQRCG